MNAPQRTILFLIADTGAGHRSAANAISHALKLISQQEQEEWRSHQQEESKTGDMPPPPTYRIEIVDVFEEYSRFPLREAMKLYGPTIRYNPKLFGRFFHISNQNQTVLAVQSMASPLIHTGLLRLITSIQPDVIVSIHPLLNHVTINAIRDLGIHIPFLTVVTDLVSIHHAWFAPGADAYIVPTEEARSLYLKWGLDAERVHMLGMPIDPKFTFQVDNKAALKKKLELDPGLPVVLLVGGGDGAGGLRASVRAISQARLAVQLLVVTGRNKRLYTNLQRTHMGLRVPAKIFGFVYNMPEMMHASDVIVTKAGPGTICEALSCDLPVILSGYVPGQEEGNVDFVLENDVGVMAQDSADLVNTLRKLVKPGSQVMLRQLENARRISRPRASFDIGEKILSFLPPADQPGIWETPHVQTRQHAISSRLRLLGTRRPIRPELPALKRLAALRQTARRQPLALRRTHANPKAKHAVRQGRVGQLNKNKGKLH